MKVIFSNKDRKDIVKSLEYRKLYITDALVKKSLDHMKGELENHFNTALSYVAEDAYYNETYGGCYVR
jgi:hypothetical protein